MTDKIMEIDNNKSVISIKNLAKSFDDNSVLKNLNLELKKGETKSILGKSGSGKSVLLKIIIGLIPPDEGEIIVLGKKISDLEYKELLKMRQKVGFIFQSGALYDSMTVRENLEFPLIKHLNLKQEEIDKKVKEILDKVELKDAIEKMPSELSGGMRKRVGVARALILKPEIMLWDEPTTGLDPETSHDISELIVKTQKDFNVSSIVITHDIPTVKTVAGKISVLKDGHFLAEGTFDELKDSEEEFVKSFFKYNLV